jgi:integrase/recombinase XerD
MQLEAHQVMDLYDYVLKTRNEIQEMRPKRKDQQPVKSDRLFINEGGSHEHFSNMITQLMIKVRKINPSVKNAKQLRASVIVKWLKQHNLRQVQYLAGHRYISSTENYQHNDMEELKEEVQQFHPLGQR